MLSAATSPTAGLPLALVTPLASPRGGDLHGRARAHGSDPHCRPGCVPLLPPTRLLPQVRWRGNQPVLREEAARPVPAMRGHEGHAAGRLPLAMVMRTGCG